MGLTGTSIRWRTTIFGGIRKITINRRERRGRREYEIFNVFFMSMPFGRKKLCGLCVLCGEIFLNS
jgi:hypothetical protein